MTRPALHLAVPADTPPDPIDALREAMFRHLTDHLDALAVADNHARQALRLAKLIAPGIAHELERWSDARGAYADRITAIQERTS